jgi:hypothetical protein
MHEERLDVHGRNPLPLIESDPFMPNEIDPLYMDDFRLISYGWRSKIVY